MKKLFAVLLIVALLTSVLPGPLFAQEDGPTGDSPTIFLPLVAGGNGAATPPGPGPHEEPPAGLSVSGSLTPQSVANRAVRKGDAAEVAAAGEPLVSVIVQLESEPLATYDGDIPGLPATAPRVLGASKLDAEAPQAQRYMDYLAQEQSRFEATVNKAGLNATIVHRYKAALNGVSMLVPESQLATLSALPGVKRIYIDEMVQPTTEVTPIFIGAPVAWRQAGGLPKAGEGVIVGVLDTGIWPEHPSYSDPDPLGIPYPPPPGGPYACEFGSSVPGDNPFTCNNKLIGAYRFMDTYELFGPPLGPGEFRSARDNDGHGTHTSSTAAGNAGVPANIFGIPRGLISGIAPRAHIIAYKVCGAAGCFLSDSAAAVDQAILDGVDVINFSIGGGSAPYSSISELAFLDAYEAGVFVAASAGNSGPGPDTVAHRGPWVTTVAASTSPRHFISTVTLTADNGDTLTLKGASITGGIDTPTPVVFPPAGEELCLNPLPAGTFNGEIVICRRGVIARVAKSYNVAQGGAGGMLLYNPVMQGLATDNHFIPSVHLEADSGQELLDFMDSHTGVMATFTQGEATLVQPDVMASFSSRGGPGQTLGVSKPDITAPGVQILAGHTPMPDDISGGVPGQLFQSIQGTSMSSPHIAGAAAMIKAIHPDWTPGQIKSALMTTAKTRNVFKEDGETPADPFDFGSGRVDLRKAGTPGLTFDETADNYRALENELWNANYPSLYVPIMPGRVTVQRTVHNTTSKRSVWRLKVDAPDDVEVTVPKKITVPGDGDATFDITVDARNVPIGEVRHATVTMRRGRKQLHFPITIVRREPDITMEKSCDPGVIAKGDATTCTITVVNNSFDDATVDVRDVLPKQLELVSGSVTGATEVSSKEIQFSGTVAGAEPPIVTVASGSSPYGYVSLASLGVAPFSGVGDETIVNFGTDPFVFAGETWTSIGMVSNGYAVVGGGTSADVTFIPQSLPDPARPNNVIAPFWTDLDGSAGGNFYAADLTDGVKTWVVLEWEDVPEFGGSDAYTFQIWIETNSGVEDISMVYARVDGDGSADGLTVGAENKFGNSGAEFGAVPTPADEIKVSSVPGAPGEAHVITFQATGVKKGAYQNCAELESPTFFGTSIACFDGEVTR